VHGFHSSDFAGAAQGNPLLLKQGDRPSFYQIYGSIYNKRFGTFDECLSLLKKRL
jgi:hypothetical protein